MSDNTQQNRGSAKRVVAGNQVSMASGKEQIPQTEVDAGAMSIGELAHAAGVTRRVVRFYVQRELLKPPGGKGRGSFYHRSHLRRLLRIKELQAAGHSLEAIGILLDSSSTNSIADRADSGLSGSGTRRGTGTEKSSRPQRLEGELPLDHDIAGGSSRLLDAETRQPGSHTRNRAQTKINAELWTRLEVAPGAELHLDMSRHRLETDKLKKLKNMIMIELDG